MDTKFNKIKADNDKQKIIDENKLAKYDFDKDVNEMIIKSLKQLIIKDKTITLKDNKFEIDIDGDIGRLTPTEMIILFIESYNDINKTYYSTDVKFNNKEFIEYYQKKKGIKIGGKTASISRGAGITASVRQGAGLTEASVRQGAGIIELDKSIMYNIPRRFL